MKVILCISIYFCVAIPIGIFMGRWLKLISQQYKDAPT